MMEARTADMLEQIHAEMRDAGEQVQPPASPEAIDALHAFAERELHTPLPQDYIDFLRRADGLDFNGTVIYATAQRSLPGGLTLLGFPESNRDFAAGQGHDHVLFGETGDELYALDKSRGQFLLLDRASLSPLEQFASCEAMLAAALRRAYES
jgi:hypothetical protein